MGLAEGGCHTSSDAQHLPESVFIAVSNLSHMTQVSISIPGVSKYCT